MPVENEATTVKDVPAGLQLDLTGHPDASEEASTFNRRAETDSRAVAPNGLHKPCTDGPQGLLDVRR